MIWVISYPPSLHKKGSKLVVPCKTRSKELNLLDAAEGESR